MLLPLYAFGLAPDIGEILPIIFELSPRCPSNNNIYITIMPGTRPETRPVTLSPRAATGQEGEEATMNVMIAVIAAVI